MKDYNIIKKVNNESKSQFWLQLITITALLFSSFAGFGQNSHTTAVDILGSSLGGFIAQKVAIAEPGLIRRVILTGAARDAIANRFADYKLLIISDTCRSKTEPNLKGGRPYPSMTVVDSLSRRWFTVNISAHSSGRLRTLKPISAVLPEGKTSPRTVQAR